LLVSGRLTRTRASSLVGALAALLLTVLTTGTALAATPPTARMQHPGDVAGYRLPFAPGLEVSIQQAWNSSYSHNGRAAYAYDFGLYEGTPVLAAASGIVSHVHDGETACGGKEMLLHANYVTIDHPDGSATTYGHLSRVGVREGDVVAAGQQIGRSGKTGFTGCMPHLHFARQIQGGDVTQSLPVYFEGYPNRPLRDGEIVHASAPCAIDGPTTPEGAFCAAYAPADAALAPYFRRLDAAIDFDWDKRAPGGYWLDNARTGFSAHWSGRFAFSVDGIYTLQVVATDRVRVTVDGEVVLESWMVQPKARTLVATLGLKAGVHVIELYQLDADGRGVLRLEWDRSLIDGPWARWAVAEPAM